MTSQEKVLFTAEEQEVLARTTSVLLALVAWHDEKVYQAKVSGTEWHGNEQRSYELRAAVRAILEDRIKNNG